VLAAPGRPRWSLPKCWKSVPIIPARLAIKRPLPACHRPKLSSCHSSPMVLAPTRTISCDVNRHQISIELAVAGCSPRLRALQVCRRRPTLGVAAVPNGRHPQTFTGARMRSARSACLFFRLQLPNMLRCQRIPSQTFQESAASFCTAQSIRGRTLPRAFCRDRIIVACRTVFAIRPVGSARAASANVRVLMMRASGVRHAWEVPSRMWRPCPVSIPPRCGRRASRRSAWR